MLSYAMVVAGRNTLAIEPSDPLYIHPYDHPGQSLVGEVFAGEEFDKWKRVVLIELSAKNKTVFIDGSYVRPAADSPLSSLWQRCNDMVLSWLFNSLHKDIRDSVLYCQTAAQMWKELNERYGQSNKVRLLVRQDVSNLPQGSLDMASYFFNKAKKIWDEFSVVGDLPQCVCGLTSSSLWLLMHMLTTNYKVGDKLLTSL